MLPSNCQAARAVALGAAVALSENEQETIVSIVFLSVCILDTQEQLITWIWVRDKMRRHWVLTNHQVSLVDGPVAANGSIDYCVHSEYCIPCHLRRSIPEFLFNRRQPQQSVWCGMGDEVPIPNRSPHPTEMGTKTTQKMPAVKWWNFLHEICFRCFDPSLIWMILT